MIRTRQIGKYTIGYSDLNKHILKSFAGEQIDLSKYTWIKGNKWIKKATEKAKILSAPYSMTKLIDLEDKSIYVTGSMRAIRNFVIMNLELKNAELKKWFDAAYFPGEDPIELFQEIIGNFKICGNGLLLKIRDLEGKWTGLERFLPTECTILEKYENNIPHPDYIQTRNMKKTVHVYKDVIHLKQSTRKSDFWGLPKLSHVTNVMTLNEIDTFNYNNFKNGLLIDYFIIVEGGTLRDNEVVDKDGNVVIADAYKEIEAALNTAKGNNHSHGVILIESENPEVKIRLENMRQQDKDGGFLKLAERLEKGIYTYYGTPQRIVAQATAGQLGGSDNSDILLFYLGTAKNNQRKLALILAKNFREEAESLGGWAANVTAEDFDFGNLYDEMKSDDMRIWDATSAK